MGLCMQVVPRSVNDQRADAGQMSEEIQNAANIVPKSIVLSYFYNGLLGLGMILAMLFARGDLSTLENPPSGYAFIEIYYQATHSVAGTAIMASFILIMQFCATISVQTSASRMLWSFSRDMGVPGWNVLRRVRSLIMRAHLFPEKSWTDMRG